MTFSLTIIGKVTITSSVISNLELTPDCKVLVNSQFDWQSGGQYSKKVGNNARQQQESR
jgi:hypothetical protein